MKTTLTSVCLALVVTGSTFAQSDYFKDKFDTANRTLISAGSSGNLGDVSARTWSWANAYHMEGLLKMHRSTGDVQYLNDFVAMSDYAVSALSSNNGNSTFLNQSPPTWTTDYYTNGNTVAWGVHTGQIANPMANFKAHISSFGLSNHAYNQPSTYLSGATFGEIADQLVTVASNAVSFHSSQMINTASGADYVHDPAWTAFGFSGGYVPLNHAAALGRTHLSLYRSTGDTTQRDIAVGLGLQFETELTPMTGGGFTWRYRGNGHNSTVIEDISHASIDVSFATELFGEGLVFDQIDMDQFYLTLENTVIPNGFSKYVDGSGGYETLFSLRAGRWQLPDMYSARTFDLFEDYYKSEWGTGAIGADYRSLIAANLFVASSVPEPTSALVLYVGILVFAVPRRRR